MAENCKDCLFYELKTDGTFCKCYSGINNPSLAVLCKKYEKAPELIEDFDQYKQYLSQYDLGELKAEFGEDIMHLVYVDKKEQCLCLESMEKGNERTYSTELIYDGEDIFKLRDILVSICKEIE